MNRRTPLIIPMAAFELLCLALAVVVVLCHPPTGKRFSEWMIRHLPGPEFYGFTQHLEGKNNE